MANFGDIESCLNIGAGQSVRRNAGDTAFEAYTPSGGGGSGDVVGPASATDNAIARYDGTTGKLIQNSGITISDQHTLENVNAVDFDITPSGSTPAANGRLVWNTTEHTLELGIGEGTVTALVGVDNHIQCYQSTGSAIARGKVVYVIGSSGLKVQVALAKGDADANNAQTIGLTAEAISNNQSGEVITKGLLRDCNTSAFNEDDILWIDPDTAGEITNVRPTAPDHAVRVGYCIKKSASQGIIYVDILNGYELGELHNVYINGVGSNHFLVYDSTVGETRWENRSPADARTALGLGAVALQGDGDKGDITVSSSGASWTIDNQAVTYAKIQDVSATDKVLGRSSAGAGSIEEITLTSAGRALIDDADASAQRTTLGLGSIATQSASSVSITGGSITGITDLAIADGGTNSSSQTTNGVTYYNGTGIVSGSKLTWTGTTFGVESTGTQVSIKYDATNYGSISANSTGDLTLNATGTGITPAEVKVTPNLTVTGSIAASNFSGSHSGTSSGTNTGDQNIFSTVAVSGQSNVVADTTSDTLTFANGTGIAITTDATTDTITIGVNGVPTLSGNNAFTGANTFTNSTGQIFRQAATQDGVLLRGRAGGTSSYTAELIPTTLTASRVLTLPDATDTVAVLAASQAFTNKTYNGLTLTATTGTFTLTNAKTLTVQNTLTFSGTDSSSVAFGAGGTVAYLGTANAFTGANTFTNSTGQIFRQAATQDGVLVRGRAGGTSSYNLELIPTTLTASRTITFPDATTTVAGLSVANVFTALQESRLVTEQLRLSYSATVYTSFTKDSSGTLTMTNVGGAGNKDFVFSQAADFQFKITGGNYYTNFQMTDLNGSIAMGLYNTPVIQSTAGLRFRANTTVANVSTTGHDLIINTSGNVGIGSSVSPSARLHLLSTTEQFRIAYDANNFTKFTVGSGGTLSVQALTTNGATAGIINFPNTYVQFSTGGNISSQGTWFPYSDGNNYISATSTIFRDSTNTTFLTLSNTSATYIDGVNMAFGTTTGTKIGTATSQKIGFYNATPIVQVTTAVAAATFVANTGTAVNDASTFDGYTIKQVVKALRNLGLLA